MATAYFYETFADYAFPINATATTTAADCLTTNTAASATTTADYLNCLTTNTAASAITTDYLPYYLTTTNSTCNNYIYPPVQYYSINRVSEPSKEELERERQALLLAEEKRKLEEEKRQKERDEADKRARELLLEYLDEKNKELLLGNNPIEIKSKLFKGMKYQIPVNAYDRVKAIRDNKTISELCVTVKKSGLPIDDIRLTKLLHIKNNEEYFIRTANHSNVKENLLSMLN